MSRSLHARASRARDRPLTRTLLAYAAAIVGGAGSAWLLASFAGRVGHGPDLEPLLVPVVVAAYLGGIRAGGAAAGVVGAGGLWLVWGARWPTPAEPDEAIVEWLALVASSTLVSVLFEAVHRERSRARDGERRYAVTLESIGDGVIATGPDGRVTFLNREAARVLGVEQGVVRGLPLGSIHAGLADASLAPDDGSATRRLDLERGRATLHFETMRTAIRGDAGEVDGHVIVVRDITERERAQAEVQRWADAFTSCAHGIALGDPMSEKVVACNPALAHLLGREPADVVGRPILSLYDPTAHAWVRDGIALADREGRARYEARMLHRDGSLVPVAVEVTTIADADGRPRYRVASVLDLRERDRAIEQIRLQARLLELAFDPTLVWELDGSIRLWNDGATRLYGYGAAEALGRRPHELLGIREEGGAAARRDALARAGEWSGVLLHRHRDGHRIEVESRQQVIADANGQPLVLETNHDVTERRRLTRALADREHQLSLFIEHAPAAIAMFDRDMRYLAASQRWLADYGLGEVDLAGRCHYDVFPEIGEVWKDVHRRALAGEVITADSDRFERANGAVQWLRWEVRPWHEPGGAVGGIVVFSEDITRSVEANGALEASERRLATIIENLAEGIVIADPAGRIVHWNRAAMEMFGFERREDWLLALPDLARWFVVSMSDGDDVPPERWPMARVIRGEVVTGVEMRVRRRDGDWDRTFTSSGVRVKEPSGQELAILSLADVTERKRAERALEERTADLARSNTDLEQFAYVASHDLKEPLRAVAGCVAILERRYRDRLDERANELIHHAVEGSARMQQLIDDLLAYSRVGTRGARFAPIALDEALDGALRNLATSLAERGAEVTREALPTVEADPAQLTSVLQNLVGNAVKFCAGPPRVHVGARRDGERWIVSVRDNGIGIAPEYSERVFGVFQRLHTRTEYPGTGIGLAISKKVIERHGGRIWLEPNPGAGTTFLFSLPVPHPPRGAPPR